MGLTAGSRDLESTLDPAVKPRDDEVDVMFFSYRSTDAWWQHLAENLNFTTSTCVVSDMRGDGTINIVDDFYTNIRNKDCANFAIQHLSEETCNEIIRRCRVLRNLKKITALSMIGAMWLTLDDIITRKKPRLAMSFTIDRYVLDVLERVLKSHGIQFLEMTASIVPDQVMFMSRGKLIQVREPVVEEITQTRKQIVNDTFTPSYVSMSKKYNRRQFWRTFLIYKLRGVFFQFIRKCRGTRRTPNSCRTNIYQNASHPERSSMSFRVKIHVIPSEDPRHPELAMDLRRSTLVHAGNLSQARNDVFQQDDEGS